MSFCLTLNDNAEASTYGMRTKQKEILCTDDVPCTPDRICGLYSFVHIRLLGEMQNCCDILWFFVHNSQSLTNRARYKLHVIFLFEITRFYLSGWCCSLNAHTL